VSWVDPRLLAFKAPEALPLALERLRNGLACVSVAAFANLPQYMSSTPSLVTVPFVPLRDGLREIRDALESLEQVRGAAGEDS
jgi:hypothetical protein